VVPVQKVNLQAVEWSVQAANALAGAAGNDPTYTMDDLQREIKDGSATLYAVQLGQERLGYVVLWVDDFGGTKELVIQSGRALARDNWAVAMTLPVLRAFAKSRGCLSMRAHSSDGAMIGRLKKGGFHRAETVMRDVF